MLLDLFFLLVVQNAGGQTVEILVEQDVLQWAQEISIAEYGVDIQDLVAEVVIEILEESKAMTGGDYQILSVGADSPVSTTQAGHLSAISILTGTIDLAGLAAAIVISSSDPVIALEFLGSGTDTAIADVIDRD